MPAASSAFMYSIAHVQPDEDEPADALSWKRRTARRSSRRELRQGHLARIVPPEHVFWIAIRRRRNAYAREADDADGVQRLEREPAVAL